MIRKIIELAISAGRKRLCEQTGFVHYNYQYNYEEIAFTIPVYENFLYSLALLRSKTAENIHEAKRLLESLIYFHSNNQFPVYLHEYPHAKDRWLGAQLLVPLYWILAHFGPVLGNELRIKLQACAHNLLEYCLEIHKERPAPYPIAIKIAAAAHAFGKGEQWLHELNHEDRLSWNSPEYIGEMLSALQMAYPSIKNSPWKAFWEHVGNTWHQSTSSFAGLPLRELHSGFEPEVTLYDLYLGAFSGSFSDRALASQMVHLKGALIQPTEDPLDKVITAPFTYATLERQEGWNPAVDRSFFPLKVMWGTPKRAHTLVCQGGETQSSSYTIVGNQIHLTFNLKQTCEWEEREKNREVGLFLDYSEDHKIYVNGISATTFSLSDEVFIHSKLLQAKLHFEILEGDGEFFGHIMQGNRPAQLSIKGNKRYNAYDWQIFLRTVRRSEACRLKATITLGG